MQTPYDMNMMDVGEVAERAGVQPSRLRYCEEIGLIR
ncbi:MerR family DNA-binding transcriptional regulator [Mesorhizobium yinganensis]